MNNHRLDAVHRVFSGRLPRRAAFGRLTRGAAAGLLASVGLKGAGTQHASTQSAAPPAGASAYIVIRRYQLLPDAAMDDLVERVDEGFVSVVSQIPGFQEYLFVDAGNGAHLTISLYDDPSGAEQSTRDAADWAAEAVAELIEGPPEVTTGWVRIHVDADGSMAATPAP
ncbi:MAG: hypothetical protein KY456_08405 [Chloroflexi bacterium]|nr:hypothetical protein [Chloroflexota bacterium]